MTFSSKLAIGQAGVTAVEVALLLPVLTSLLLGIIGGSLLMNTIGSLHYAVEGAARCGGINAASCTTRAATQSYAAGLYTGPSSPAPVFTPTPGQPCGYQVSGSVTYVLDVVVAKWTIPLSATACFP